MAALTQMFAQLPIWATRIGFHSHSTEEQRAFAEFMFNVHGQWQGWQAGRPE